MSASVGVSAGNIRKVDHRTDATSASWPMRYAVLAALCGLLLLSGCGHKQAARVSVPPPPGKNGTAISTDNSDKDVAPGSKSILYEETGLASWYGPPYINRRTANGEIYERHALIAAHRTLPLNSLARVTNLQTGRSATVRITDRGPFIEGRFLDLSVDAAKQVDVWGPGTALVKLQVLQAPASIGQGGRWCVQAGAFSSKSEAAKLKQDWEHHYRDAQVLQFTGPTGDWVRIRPAGDDKQTAQAILHKTKVPEGAAFLVRLD